MPGSVKACVTQRWNLVVIPHPLPPTPSHHHHPHVFSDTSIITDGVCNVGEASDLHRASESDLSSSE